MSQYMVFSKYTHDLQTYLESKLPDVPAHVVQEVAAHIGNKTMILVNDMIREHDGDNRRREEQYQRRLREVMSREPK